jgi:6-phosphogluconolactonase/glucosamine-6-phosphate isomerase/deaminase
LPVLANARHIGVLVTGRSKARALAAALAAEAETPAAVLARTAQTAVWWVDRDAADMRDQGAARDR